jgi:diguanylate cyclase (GGDEF)-like protein
LQNAQLFESVEKQLKQITTLREIDRTLNSMLELEPMLDATLDLVAQLVPYDYAAIFTLEGHWLRAVAGRGISAEALRHLAFDTSQHPGFYRMWRRHRPVILRNVHASKDWIITPGLEDVQSWMGVPFIARDQVLGQLSLYRRIPNAFTQEHSDLIWAFANHAAIAIANARLHAELYEQAQHDSLTQVLNHGTLIQEVRLTAEQAQRARQPLALIMLDLDDFKQYNDTYGHVVGDEVLRATVQAIRTHVKQTDLVGRWGGEEFSIALRNANQAQALLVANRIRETLATTHIQARDGTPIPAPTVSQGIAVLGHTAHTVDELIDQADRALYHAKHRGKDQIICAP